MTPAMQQFHEIKSDYPDHIVLFRMGDFYETFYEDAKKASQILGITLTARDKERKTPMAGIPFHALDGYLNKLVDNNQKVVIVEQLENPKEAKGVIKRGIVKIVTPGTSTAEKHTKSSNFLASIALESKKYYLSYVDIIEGNIRYCIFDNKKDFENNLLVLDAKEILINQDADLTEYFSKENTLRLQKNLNFIPEKDFSLAQIELQFSDLTFKILKKLDLKALWMLADYLVETQKTELAHITSIEKIVSTEFMNLDMIAVRNLELIEGTHKDSLSLFSLLDQCKTTVGSKKLRSWLVTPLLNVEKINLRLNSIESLLNYDNSVIEGLHTAFEALSDLQRISSKLGLRTANARDLRNIVESSKSIFQITHSFKQNSFSAHIEALVAHIEEELKTIQPKLALLDKQIKDMPPLSVREGGMIKSGVDADLDQLHDLKNGGKEWLANFEKNEIQSSGIPTLKVRFNKVFGYYIEISKGQMAKVPAHYIRKQTLVNAERYITPELKEQEANILGADDRVCKIEFELFSKLLEETVLIIPNLQKLSEYISELDIYLTLAKLSRKNNWIKPSFSEEKGILEIEEGRHPIIEHFLQKAGKNFIANNAYLTEESSLQIITGPNMGGKSTYIRQAALIALMSQIGLFVPAKKVTMSIIDRIFTRVGASDNLSQGESTFMVEMLETAEILTNATPKSLIILDEVGRGTSTFDGMSIAWAICEFLQNLGAKTLFATHYHELTELANKYSNVKNLAVKVLEYNQEIIFMHQIIEGKADKSYGIHVAKLAGVPTKVLNNASKILKILEKEKNKLQPKPLDLFDLTEPDHGQLPQAESSPVLSELQKINTNMLSPIEALNLIIKWKNDLLPPPPDSI